jgi:hypothetical protein
MNGISEEADVAFLRVLSQHSLGETEENHKSSVMLALTRQNILHVVKPVPHRITNGYLSGNMFRHVGFNFLKTSNWNYNTPCGLQ